MKENKRESGGYATNKGGVIKSPKNPSAGDPKVDSVKGNDLRTPGGKKN